MASSATKSKARAATTSGASSARAVVTSGWGLLELRPMRMSLEDVFLSLTTEEAPTAPCRGDRE